jgi:hypothetical protein
LFSQFCGYSGQKDMMRLPGLRWVYLLALVQEGASTECDFTAVKP